MDNFPSALAIASYDSVCHNNNVLYRLVRPLPDGSGVQSTDRLVNVVPYRRQYTFERKQQLVDFIQQILRRPLVLQPLLHFGRGLGSYCATCYQDELWLVMVNQTHPKILSRLQMGLDSAKVALEKGQPFEIKFHFGKIIQRVYQEHLAQKEQEEAQASNSAILKYLTYFRYAEWEYCDLVLRYRGHGAALNRTSAFQSLPKLEMKWDFEDIGMHDMMWSQFNELDYTFPHLSPVSEDEIRLLLPGWTINSVSPLENIGDSIPEYNYDYAQAGRLYASFRKNRQSRSRPEQTAGSEYSSQSMNSNSEPYPEEDFDEKHQAAVKFKPVAQQSVYVDPNHVIFEHDIGYPDMNSKSSSQSQYQDPDSFPDQTPNHRNINQPDSDIDFPLRHYDTQVPVPSHSSHTYAHNVQTHSSEGRHEPGSHMKIQQPDRYEHIYNNIDKRLHKVQPHRIQTHASININHAEVDARSSHVHDDRYSGQLKKQDSDRSSRSTITDSGYYPEGDSDRSHGGSYDYNEQNHMQRPKQDDWGYVNFPTRSINNDGGLVNPAFNVNGHGINHSVHRNKQYVSKDIKNEHDGSKSNRPNNPSLGRSIPGTVTSYAVSPKESVVHDLKVPPRQKRLATTNTSPKVAESYI